MTDRRTDICDCRVAFATENAYKLIKDIYKHIDEKYLQNDEKCLHVDEKPDEKYLHITVQGMARLCCDTRQQVRTQSLTLLQRSLLVPDLQVHFHSNIKLFNLCTERNTID